MPRALILAPQRRSMVSSMAITTGPCGTKVVTSKAGALFEAHDAQRGRDGTPTRHEERTGDEDQDVAPDRGREAPRKGPHPFGHDPGPLRRHGSHLGLDNTAMRNNACPGRGSRWLARMRCWSGSRPILGR